MSFIVSKNMRFIQFVDDKTSGKILKQARQQQRELEEEHDIAEPRQRRVTLNVGKGSDSEDEGDITFAGDFDESIYEDLKLDKDDEKAIEMFMSKDAPQRKTLADLISEKLKEKETEIDTHFSQAGDIKFQDLDPRVIELYKGVKQVLSRYRAGKLPKAFKIIPSLANWEQILELTSPDTWSAAAVYAGTRIFTSNLKEKMAQRFFNLVLLPRVRDDIFEFKRLNAHLYLGLRKALFKPGAFFKGIILPLCEGGDCTLREAVIIGSVIAKNHIPILHCCAAMLKISEMEYSGANSIFLHILINKKYALPYRVIDGVVHHFLRFISDKRELPLLWHQCLLVFVQNYKSDLTCEQKEAILELLRVHSHRQITSIVRTELFNTKSRDVEAEPIEQDEPHMSGSDDDSEM